MKQVLYLPPPKGKFCERCGKDKDFSAFRQSVNGFSANCKECSAQKGAERKKLKKVQGLLF
jgi:hypothetical protein